MRSLKLVIPTKEYEEDVMAYREAFLSRNEMLYGCAGLEDVTSYDEWLDFENRLSEKFGDGYIPSTLMLAIRISDNKLIGIIDLRHDLSDFLLHYGGHIGYSVLPLERQKGYGKEILEQMVEIAKTLGMNRILVICDKENIASAKTIQSNGGVLENEILDESGSKVKVMQRYWIGGEGE